MNIVQQAEQLKYLPDQELARLSQQPAGGVPPYLVVAEMQRRESMRKAYQASAANPMEKTTVVEDMRARLNPTTQAQPQQPQGGGLQQMQQSIPPAPALRFAEGGSTSDEDGGGLSSLADYFDSIGAPAPASQGQLPQVDPSMLGGALPGPEAIPFDPQELATTPEQLNRIYGSFDDLGKQAQAAMASRKSPRLEGLAAELAAREEMYRKRKPGLGEVLMQLGLGMAASRRPDWAGAIGEGGLSALHGYTAGKERNEALANSALAQRAGVLEALQRSDDTATRSMDDYLRALMAGRNTSIMTAEEAKRAILRSAQQERTDQLHRKTQMDVAEVHERRADAREMTKLLMGRGDNVETRAIDEFVKLHPDKTIIDAVAAYHAAKSPKTVDAEGPFRKKADEFLKLYEFEAKRSEDLHKAANSVFDPQQKQRLISQAEAAATRAKSHYSALENLLYRSSGMPIPTQEPVESVEPKFIYDPKTGRFVPAGAPAASAAPPSPSGPPVPSLRGGYKEVESRNIQYGDQQR